MSNQEIDSMIILPWSIRQADGEWVAIAQLATDDPYSEYFVVVSDDRQVWWLSYYE